MSIEIKAPTFPESVADGTVATWHKKPLPCHAASFWGLSNGKRPDAIARWFTAERL
jgi:hypothetical protein